MLVHLTDLVGECGNTKVIKMKQTHRKIFQWELIHMQILENMKQLIACKVILVYHNFELPFEIYTDAND